MGQDRMKKESNDFLEFIKKKSWRSPNNNLTAHLKSLEKANTPKKDSLRKSTR